MKQSGILASEIRWINILIFEIFVTISEKLIESARESKVCFYDQIGDEILEFRTTILSEFECLKRGQSFENKRGCDEIMQQFISGLDESISDVRLSVKESMILNEP